MEATSPRIRARALALCALFVFVAPVASAQQAMSTADRLMMLYAPQLTFTAEGDPLIRLGLMEGVKQLKFTPSEPIRVLPAGEGGPTIELPGGRTYTVEASGSQPGEYRHWVIVERLPLAQRERAESLKQMWLERGHLPEIFEVGGLFAVRGKVFDSRTILFAVGGSNDKRAAEALQTKLQSRYGIEGGVHGQLVKHPSALLTLKGEGLEVTIQHRDILQITSRTGREAAQRYKVPNIAKSYGKGFETRTYTGDLIIAPDRAGQLVLINSLGAEKVLKGVVPAEIYASAPPAALQAQAIAARNEIFSAIGVRNLAEPYMLRSDVYDQVYGGVGVEDARTSAAVDATRGQVMFYGDAIVEAFYSSNAGGFTENNENVWAMEPRPYLRGKPDAPASEVPAAFKGGITEANLSAFLTKGLEAYSKNAPVSSSKLFRWDATVEASQPERWLKEAGHDLGRLRDLKIVRRGVSGRVIQLEAVGERGKATVERELNVRRLFGGLRSGLFIMTIERDARGFITTLSFQGGGFGHGVGMCQTGAAGLAATGATAQQILTHYYQGVTVKPLY